MAARRFDLDRIRRLRAKFLAERGGRALVDYWRDERDLAAYDALLGARIAWKWDAALAECADRGMPRADGALVLDYGCGSGVAARRFAVRFGAGEVWCHDRSELAMAFACRRLGEELPAVAARPVAAIGDVEPDVLLVSHVLGELDARGEARLAELIARSRCAVLVESGTREVGRRLSRLREGLLARMHVLAPCPGTDRCPALLDERDWCHFFATPPGEVFTDGAWVKAARELGIDLRSLAYSFLALQQDPVAGSLRERPLGRARLSKHAAEVRVCSGGELRTRVIAKRSDAATWRALKKSPERVRELQA